MKKDLVISTIAAIAAQNPEGYTVNAATLQPITSGYAVALAVTQDSFGAKGLKKVVDVINKMQNIQVWTSIREEFVPDFEKEGFKL